MKFKLCPLVIELSCHLKLKYTQICLCFCLKTKQTQHLVLLGQALISWISILCVCINDEISFNKGNKAVCRVTYPKEWNVSGADYSWCSSLESCYNEMLTALIMTFHHSDVFGSFVVSFSWHCIWLLSNEQQVPAAVIWATTELLQRLCTCHVMRQLTDMKKGNQGPKNQTLTVLPLLYC